MDSSTIARFSLGVVWRTVVTCHGSLLPTRVQTGAPLSVRARRLASSSQRPLARRVAPNAASLARFRGCLPGLAKSSSSLGFDPGKPPSPYSNPSPSTHPALPPLSPTQHTHAVPSL